LREAQETHLDGETAAGTQAKRFKLGRQSRLGQQLTQVGRQVLAQIAYECGCGCLAMATQDNAHGRLAATETMNRSRSIYLPPP
jgi:hypothetical protein